MLVKPPPTAAKNPLNLQVQLVINEKKTRPRRASDAVTRAAQSSGELSSAPSTPQRQSYEKLDDGADPEKTPVAETSTVGALASGATPSGGKVKRSDSVSSTRSSSAASAVSATSTQSGKRIIPLYNLAVHNVVQPTIVTDAGTDSRVAKVSKRARRARFPHSLHGAPWHSPTQSRLFDFCADTTVLKAPAGHFWCRHPRAVRSVAALCRPGGRVPSTFV